MTPDIIVLPTDQLLEDFRNIIHDMTYHEYDLIEGIGVVLGALSHRNLYPHSLKTQILDMLDRVALEDVTTANDMAIYKRGLTFLYHQLYAILDQMGLYGPNGTMEHVYYDLYNNELMVSRHSKTFDWYRPLPAETSHDQSTTHSL